MRILTLTTLYPNAAAPSHGVFVENRLRAFIDRHAAEARVIAPVPWFPFSGGWAGRYAAYARTPYAEIRRGLEVTHPRYAIPPKIGMTYAARALERCFYRAASNVLESGWDFDLIDAHYLYPDGVAAVRVARRLGKPVVVTARGADVNLLPHFPRQRTMILEAACAADGVICVAAALKEELIKLGAPPEKIVVARNGVDLALFRPLDRDGVRARLGLSGKVIASVGHLIERKGHHLVIEALTALPEATLIVVGGGEEATSLRRLAHKLGVGDRVRFLGALRHEELVDIYNAADVLALASSREGWPNVLLEAMACGTQAVATPVWGSVEVVNAPAAGRLAKARTSEAMAEALRAALEDPPRREETRAFAEKYSWDETSDTARRVYDAAIKRGRAAAAISCRPLVPKVAKGGPRLIVTVDTEEIFDWTRFAHTGHKIADPADIEQYQALAASFGIRPLYFLTHPMIADAASRDYFLGLHRAGAADLGLHLHQWTTPPFDGFTHPYYSFQCNLPPDLHREKLRVLADAFEKAFGFRARAHRAGRYGISPACYEALASIGVDLDFSPSVAFDNSGQGGPNFSAMSNSPFAVDMAGLPSVRVIPLSGMRALKRVKFLLPQEGQPGFCAGAPAWRIALSWPKRLTCEGSGLAQLKSLTRRLVSDGVPVLTFSLHSTTMTPGAGPYARDRAAADANLSLCADFWRFFSSEFGGAFVTVDEIAALFEDQP